MSGSGIDDIDRPLSRYDLSNRRDFGSLSLRKRRDRRIARALELAAEAANTADLATQLRALAHQLAYADRGGPPPASRASYVAQGYVRLLLGSELNRLTTETQLGGAKVTFSTLAFRGGDVRPDQLLSVDPRRWAKQLNADLDRVRRQLGLTGPGWSVHFLDCDYLQTEGVFLFHWHGFATGSELDALDGLRKLRKYHSPKQQPGEPRDLVKRRVRLTRRPLRNIGYLCLYVLKEEWPSQPRARNQAGNRERSYPRPLPDQLRPLERLFFDRWRIQDISAVRGLRVVGGHLTETR